MGEKKEIHIESLQSFDKPVFGERWDFLGFAHDQR